MIVRKCAEGSLIAHCPVCPFICVSCEPCLHLSFFSRPFGPFTPTHSHIHSFISKLLKSLRPHDTKLKRNKRLLQLPNEKRSNLNWVEPREMIFLPLPLLTIHSPEIDTAILEARESQNWIFRFRNCEEAHIEGLPALLPSHPSKLFQGGRKSERREAWECLLLMEPQTTEDVVNEGCSSDSSFSRFLLLSLFRSLTFNPAFCIGSLTSSRSLVPLSTALATDQLVTVLTKLFWWEYGNLYQIKFPWWEIR